MGGGGGWHNTSLCSCLQLAAPIGLSPLTPALPLNPLPPQPAAPIGLSPPRALPPPAWPPLDPPTPPSFPSGGCANGAPRLSLFGGGEGECSFCGWVWNVCPTAHNCSSLSSRCPRPHQTDGFHRLTGARAFALSPLFAPVPRPSQRIEQHLPLQTGTVLDTAKSIRLSVESVLWVLWVKVEL